MSVYVTIKNAILKKQPREEVYVLVESPGAYLKTHNVPSHVLQWDTSLVCSIKEQGLNFKLCEAEDYAKSVLGEANLEFTDFQYAPDRDFAHILKLTHKGKQIGQLQLNIFYNEKKNYLGEMEFYQFGNVATMTTLRISNIDQFEKGKLPRERIIFYKGPCKSKNVFSCCDQETKSQQFEVVENLYRDRI